MPIGHTERSGYGLHLHLRTAPSREEFWIPVRIVIPGSIQWHALLGQMLEKPELIAFLNSVTSSLSEARPCSSRFDSDMHLLVGLTLIFGGGGGGLIPPLDPVPFDFPLVTIKRHFAAFSIYWRHWCKIWYRLLAAVSRYWAKIRWGYFQFLDFWSIPYKRKLS